MAAVGERVAAWSHDTMIPSSESGPVIARGTRLYVYLAAAHESGRVMELEASRLRKQARLSRPWNLRAVRSARHAAWAEDGATCFWSGPLPSARRLRRTTKTRRQLGGSVVVVWEWPPPGTALGGAPFRLD